MPFWLRMYLYIGNNTILFWSPIGFERKEKNHKINKCTLVQSTAAYTEIKYLLQQ